MTPNERRNLDLLAEIRNAVQVLVLKMDKHHRLYTCGVCREPFLADIREDVDRLIDLTRERRLTK